MASPSELLDESLRLYVEAVDGAAGSADSPTPCGDYAVRDQASHCILTLHSFAAPLDGGPTASILDIVAAADSEDDTTGTTKRAVERVRADYAAAGPAAERAYNLGHDSRRQAMAVLTRRSGSARAGSAPGRWPPVTRAGSG